MRVISSRPETRPGPPERFTGTVWFDEVAALPSGIHASSVHFSPGARTAWHTHPGGQILQVVEGVGRVQDRGGPVEEIRAGTAVVVDAGVWHWHGASPHHFMTHLAVYEGDAQWGDPVTDDDYLAPPRS